METIKTDVEFSELVGKTIIRVDQIDDYILRFYVNENEFYEMSHDQDCCESVSIEDITGEMENLIGEVIIYAKEESNQNTTQWGTETWTFYKIWTNKVCVDIRWHGESNGYYSESVDLYHVKWEVKNG